MTAKILEFKPRAKQQEPVDLTTRAKTDYEIFCDVREHVLSDWQEHALKNRLSEFVMSIIPAAFRYPGDRGDYVNDLNVIAQVERKLDMQVSIFYPGCTYDNQYGWMATFHSDKTVYPTPPDMASEANARALNIVLFLEFKSTLRTLGRA